MLSLKHAFKSLQASKLYTSINLIGLTLGIACTLVLIKYVRYELATDHFHPRLDRIVMATIQASPVSEPRPINAGMFFDLDYLTYPEVQYATEVHFYENTPIQSGQNQFYAHVLTADSSFFDVFNFPLSTGPNEKMLADPSTILLTQKLAQRIFGSNDPLGKTLTFEGIDFSVAGIFEPTTGNSSLQFDAIVSTYATRFWSRGHTDYLVLNPNTDLNDFNEKIKDAGHKHPQFQESIMRFFPFKELYFHHKFPRTEVVLASGNLQSVRIISLIALLILITSLFNYVNLYSVNLFNRRKELGVKKVVGAGKGDLMSSFVWENLLNGGIAIAVALVLIQLMTPFLTEFTGRSIELQFPHDIYLVLALLGVITLATSIFPMLYYPSISPMKALRERVQSRQSLRGRKVLLTLQYVVTIALLIVSFFFIKQFYFMLNRDMGFQQDRVVRIPFFEGIPNPRHMVDEAEREAAMEAYRKARDQQRTLMQYTIDQIHQNPYIQHLSFGDSPLGIFPAPWKKKGEGTQYHTINGLAITPNFADLYGLEVVEGRFFSNELDESRGKKVVINEKARDFFQLDQIPGSFVSNRYWGDDEKPFEVIGVVKDFHNQHLSNPLAPLVMYYHYDTYTFSMQLEKGHEKEGLAFLQNLFAEVNPGRNFDYTFIDTRVKEMYEEDRRAVRVYSLFAILTLFISSIGLFGISLYDVQQRIKEIGIRKVSGATVQQIIALLTKDFLRLILLGFVLACPIAGYGIFKYLEGFAYRTSLSWWVFAIAGGITLAVAFGTLIWQSYRAAVRNPIHALRYE